MKCPHCGGDNNGTSRFCVYCGGDMGQASAQPQQPQYQPQQSQYQTYQQPQYQPYQQPQAPYQYPNQYQAPANAIKENVPMGILGAILGSLLGGLSIILLMQLDILASISGLLLAFCTLKGYELLGKKMSNVGIVTCVLLMIVVPVASYFAGCAIAVINEVKDYVDVSFSEALEAVLMAVKQVPGDVVKDLLILYFFVALGGVGTIVTAYKANKK